MTKKQLSIFGLVMINVIAIDSLRTLPMSAMYGFSLVFYYLLAALTFFLPTALVAAELATGWPEMGGLYVWVREAFGKKMGFMTIWLQWFYNVCWYPTIMSFIAATIAYCINPSLINNKMYMLIVINSLFWFSTFVNFLGMRTSTFISTLSATMGTLIPMTFIIILGCIWSGMGKPIFVDFTWKHFFPDLSNLNNLVLLTGMLYGYVGIEMSAAHAADVRNPQKDYPKAVFWSSLIIFFSLVLASLAIALVVPAKQLNIISGLLQAFDEFFKAFHLNWLTPILAVLIICGALGGVNAWILGPGKSLLVASRDGCLPTFLCKTNRFGAPTSILWVQGILFSALSSVFLFMPTVASSFWALTNVTSILSLIVYVAMFAAALRLRYKFPHVKRSFVIPFGQVGIWIVCLVGLVSCLFTIVIGFFPPSQIPVGNLAIYETILGVGVVIGCVIPFCIYRLTKQFAQSSSVISPEHTYVTEMNR